MSQKRDVRKLNNENPVNRRVAGGEGLGTLLDAVINAVAAYDVILQPAGLAIGSDKHKVGVVNDVWYRRGGLLKKLSAAEVAFTATTHDVTGHATLKKHAKFAICINTSDTLAILKGATATVGSTPEPTITAGFLVLGYLDIEVVPGGGSPLFDATTDELDEVQLIATFTDAVDALAAIPRLV